VTVDRTVIERSWRERGFSCRLWVDPPGQVWADYVHDTDELVMVVEGDVEFEVAGKVHRPAPGEELFIPARARHTVRNLGRCAVALAVRLPPLTTIYARDAPGARPPSVEGGALVKCVLPET
jgi:quercetin dioxygenase-like cupin family protein